MQTELPMLAWALMVAVKARCIIMFTVIAVVMFFIVMSLMLVSV